MARETLGIDMDELMFPFAQNFAAFHNQHFGTMLTLNDFHSYKFHEVVTSVTEVEMVQRVYRFMESDHSAIKPIEKSQDSLARLREKYDLALITARHPDYADITVGWADEYFAGYFSHFVSIGYAPVMEKPRTKLEVCRELGVIGMVDDSLANTIECAGGGVDSVLFGNYPWNWTEDVLPAGITRCPDWDDVLEYYAA